MVYGSAGKKRGVYFCKQTELIERSTEKVKVGHTIKMLANYKTEV